MSADPLLDGPWSLRRWWRSSRSYLAAQLRAGWTRVRGAAVPNTQAAIAATISWIICHYLLAEPMPVFAPISTYLCLGFTRDRQPRKVLEIGLGTTLGVFAGDLVGQAFGFGWWQILVIMLVAPLVGRLIDRSDPTTFQTAINTLVVASMSVTAAATGVYDPAFDRWVSALVGVGVALLASAVLPVNLMTRPRRFAVLALTETSQVVHKIATGLRQGDADVIREGSGQLTAIREILNDGGDALDSALETATINPVLNRDRAELAELSRIVELNERLQITVSMLARQARAIVGEQGALVDVGGVALELAEIMQDVSWAIRDWKKPTAARDRAMTLAKRLAPTEVVEGGDWRGHSLMSLLRAATVDLLQLTGLSMAQARAALADTGNLDAELEDKAAVDDERGSKVWGTSSFPALPDDATPDEEIG